MPQSQFFRGAGGVIFEMNLPLSENMQGQVDKGTLTVVAGPVHTLTDDAGISRFVAGPAPVDTDEVPVGTVKAVTDWVGADKDRAKRALDAENATDKPRATLVAALTELLEAE